MRVADLSLSDSLAGQLDAQQSSIAQLDAELSSGYALSKPSDNPVAVVDTLGYQRQVAFYNAASNSAQTASSWLGLANQTADSVLTTYQSVRTIMLQALNSGSQNPQTYQALAQQLQGLSQTLVGLGNTRFGNMAIFSGTADVPAAYDASGNYAGNSQTFTIQVGNGSPTAASVPGTDLFGGGSSGIQSVFTTIADAVSHLGTGPSGTTEAQLQGDLAAFDANITQAQQASSTLGVASQQISTTSSEVTSANDEVEGVLSATRDVNVAQASTALQAELANYQAALWANAHAVPISLAQFIQ